ncbi:MAG TPA: iron-sulfur cluster assembly accessory protein, partial [Nitrospinaceae bacterium]|nr:iron-sulfur cluster assembly accessory protein [Nitrospinaceae bacterium]
MAVDIDFVKITNKASEEVIKLVTAENNPKIGLRLGVKGGGC